MEWSSALISMPRKTLGLNRATPACHEPGYSIAAELPWQHSSPWSWSFSPLLKSLTPTLPLPLPDLSFRLNQPVTLIFCFLLPDHMWQSLCNAQNAKWASSMNPLWNKPCHWAVNPWITHTHKGEGGKINSEVQSQQLTWWIPRSLKSISCAVHSHHTNIQLFPKSYCNYPNLATSDFCCYKKRVMKGN